MTFLTDFYTISQQFNAFQYNRKTGIAENLDAGVCNQILSIRFCLYAISCRERTCGPNHHRLPPGRYGTTTINSHSTYCSPTRHSFHRCLSTMGHSAPFIQLPNMIIQNVPQLQSYSDDAGQYALWKFNIKVVTPRWPQWSSYVDHSSLEIRKSTPNTW